MIIAADRVWWEAQTVDGRILREADGRRYLDLPFDDLTLFRLVLGATVLLEVPVPVGMTGRNLRFRRDVGVGGGTRDVRFKVGWVPDGPVFVVDVDRAVVWMADRFHTDAECRCVTGHPPGAFYPPSDLEVGVA